MNYVDLKKEACCGCAACVNVCPKNAIVMSGDEEGFRYPQISASLCVDCGLCQKACPAYHDGETSAFSQAYYAVQHNDEEVVLNSSSGGVFTALAEAVLAQNGVVYGVAFDDGFAVRHERAENAAHVKRFRGSKYVQSDMGLVMRDVAADLKAGRSVMFTGTPCQADGLKCFLAAKNVCADNLLTCDFVCHGVASPKVWQAYTALLNEQNGVLQVYDFRGKEDGWHKSFPRIIADGENVSDVYKDKQSFFLLYRTSVITRPSCYACRYTNYDRRSDITFADFWNIDKAVPAMNDDKGTSQVLVNTAVGQRWFERCQAAVKYQACTKEDAWQPHLEYPTPSPKGRERFWQAFASRPFADVIRQYGRDPLLTKCRKVIMPLINKLGLYALAGKLYRVVFVGNKKQ